MRVLITTWVFPTHGGVFSFLEKVIPVLKRGGYSFRVAAGAPSPQSYRVFPHLSGNEIHNVRQMHLPRPFSFPLLPLLVCILRTGKVHNCDLIFSQDPFYSGLPSMVASRLLGVKLVVADHGMTTNFTDRAYWANFGFRAVRLWQLLALLVMRAVFGSACGIYSPGDDVTARLTDLFGASTRGKILTLPIAIDSEAFRPNPDVRESTRGMLGLGNSPTAVFVGRLHVESGLEHLVEAAALIEPGIRPIFLIVGDGVLRDAYEEQAEKTVPGYFRFLGYSDRIAEYLNASDIFAFPKVFAGGYSISLREAMAVGLACVATCGVDSHDRIIQDGVNGILVPPRDARALSQALRRLLVDHRLRAQMGARARASVEKEFPLEGFADKLHALLEPHERRSE